MGAAITAGRPKAVPQNHRAERSHVRTQNHRRAPSTARAAPHRGRGRDWSRGRPGPGGAAAGQGGGRARKAMAEAVFTQLSPFSALTAAVPPESRSGDKSPALTEERRPFRGHWRRPGPPRRHSPLPSVSQPGTTPRRQRRRHAELRERPGRGAARQHTDGSKAGTGSRGGGPGQPREGTGPAPLSCRRRPPPAPPAPRLPAPSRPRSLTVGPTAAPRSPLRPLHPPPLASSPFLLSGPAAAWEKARTPPERPEPAPERPDSCRRRTNLPERSLVTPLPPLCRLPSGSRPRGRIVPERADR